MSINPFIILSWDQTGLDNKNIIKNTLTINMTKSRLYNDNK